MTTLFTAGSPVPTVIGERDHAGSASTCRRIPAADGTRLLTVHPAQVRRQWSTGRLYEHLRPTLTLDRIMPADEADSWLTRVQPAREPDMFQV
ncbi:MULTISPECIES: hypothetical protein [unclassified Actinoplanes]|uniref:hypothetical protein n=1 Tax=unclassified Actinoplanes TaxID=2626549 RepID=UPI00030A1DD6|nr:MULTISPECIES: hypothetical protein [unclassified Actinoplanes]